MATTTKTTAKAPAKAEKAPAKKVASVSTAPRMKDLYLSTYAAELKTELGLGNNHQIPKLEKNRCQRRSRPCQRRQKATRNSQQHCTQNHRPTASRNSCTAFNCELQTP